MLEEFAFEIADVPSPWQLCRDICSNYSLVVSRLFHNCNPSTSFPFLPINLSAGPLLSADKCHKTLAHVIRDSSPLGNAVFPTKGSNTPSWV